ncbi:MAG: hypothetical protein M3083_08375 [Actinomycetota bacterium]|nr:hypothetical protein [Actinomycetota bacterium]
MSRSSFAQPIGGAGVVVAFAFVLAACGGGTTKTAAPATTTTPTTITSGRGARQAAFRQCMQSHGVSLPAGATGFGGRAPAGDTGSVPTTTIPAGVTSQQWQAAVTACASQLPARGNLQNNPQFQLYYNCLQTYLTTHGGTTLPPLGQGGTGGLFGPGGAGGAGNGGGAGTAGGATATTNPALQAARDHCAPLRPTFGGGTTSTSTPA